IARLVASRAILRLVQDSVCLCTRTVTVGDQGPRLRHHDAVLMCTQPSGNVEDQQNECEQSEYAQGGPPAHPELPRILVRLTREIDINTHKNQGSGVRKERIGL